jgi:hypothetical protein
MEKVKLNEVNDQVIDGTSTFRGMNNQPNSSYNPSGKKSNAASNPFAKEELISECLE